MSPGNSPRLDSPQLSPSCLKGRAGKHGNLSKARLGFKLTRHMEVQENRPLIAALLRGLQRDLPSADGRPSPGWASDGNEACWPDNILHICQLWLVPLQRASRAVVTLDQVHELVRFNAKLGAKARKENTAIEEQRQKAKEQAEQQGLAEDIRALPLELAQREATSESQRSVTGGGTKSWESVVEEVDNTIFRAALASADVQAVHDSVAAATELLTKPYNNAMVTYPDFEAWVRKQAPGQRREWRERWGAGATESIHDQLAALHRKGIFDNKREAPKAPSAPQSAEAKSPPKQQQQPPAGAGRQLPKAGGPGETRAAPCGKTPPAPTPAAPARPRSPQAVPARPATAARATRPPGRAPGGRAPAPVKRAQSGGCC